MITFRKFIDREEELDFLENLWRTKSCSFIPVYGRRRVGKTELINRFIENKDAIYFLADKGGTKSNVIKFRRKAADFFDEVEPAIESFDEIFKYICKKKDKKMVVVIDEFPYLIEKDASIPSVFQYILDEILKNEDIMLILSGSSVGMMETEVIAYKSPLYGRRSGQIKLGPFGLKNIREFFPSMPLTELIKVYAVTYGIPFYLTFFDEKKEFFDNIKDNFLNKRSVLYEEGEILLKEELRDASRYKNILSAIANGATKVGEIASKSFIEVKDAPYYLDILMNLGIVKREIPITEKITTKKSLYKISDFFFLFWFKFIYSHKEDIEIENTEYVLSEVKNSFNSYLGFVFENIAKEFLIEKKPFKFQMIGRWWHKNIEIDIVTLNEETSEITFFEVKWSDLGTKEAGNILNELKEKSKFVEWNNKKRKEYFGIIAKNIENKENLKKEGYLVFDLDDFNFNKN